jgi:hypothetical protein
MSRGPGCWQRELLRVTSGVHTATVHSIVLARLPDPGRDDFAAARRGAKGLVQQERLAACYAFACHRCGVIQDRTDPQPCCAQVRPMLAVARPGRQLAHPAPVPVTAPAWVNAPAARPPPAGLPVPSLDDLVSLATRRLWEALAAGTTPVVTARDVAALARLQLLIRQDERDRVPARSDEQWKLATKELLWIARGHLGDRWPDFVTDVRASQALRDLCGPPGRDSSRTAPAR